MMNRNILWRASIFSASLAIAACGFEQRTVVGPSSSNSGSNNNGSPNNGGNTTPAPGGGTGTGPMVGTWSSEVLVELSKITSCADFQWQITSQSGNSLSGTFSAVCGGTLTIAGTATGQLDGNTVPMTVNGTASVPGLPPCSFSLSGTGTITNNDTLTIPYSGTTCLGPVHGTEVLRKKTNPPPAPDPAPAPPPPPAQSDPLLGCGGITDHYQMVVCIHDRLNPPHTVEGAFDVTRRVAWAFRGEGMGLLIKNAGENIVSWQGYSFAAARVCYPDGHIFKVLSDVPTTNGPIWLDNDFVSPSLYVPAIDPNR